MNSGVHTGSPTASRAAFYRNAMPELVSAPVDGFGFFAGIQAVKTVTDSGAVQNAVKTASNFFLNALLN